MVPGQKRKPNKPTKTKKAVFHRVREGIPFNKEEVVTRIEIIRKVKGRVFTKSTKVIVPIVKSVSSSPQPPLPPSEHNAPPTSTKEEHKGPSRSALVCLIAPSFYSN